MAKAALPAALPIEVPLEFLYRLSETVTEHERIVPVLRGSLLLGLWFGNNARPPADIDLEWFVQQHNRTRRYGRFASPLIHAKTLCMFAADSGGDIEFRETDVPEDGCDLWEYGTPGERCYVGWVWPERNETTGQLQIDLAMAGSYDLADIGMEHIQLTAPDNRSFRFAAYTPEMLLAAKLSWLMRSLKRRQGSAAFLQWTGQPKDLFDAHLLVTKASLRPRLLQEAIMAVGAEDKLDWADLEFIFNGGATLTDELFSNWPEFRQQHEHLIDCGPSEMFSLVANRLESLLANFRQEIPFLLSVKETPNDPVPYLIYADWLEERADPRGRFLRLYSELFFYDEARPALLERVRRLYSKLFFSQYPLPRDVRTATAQALLASLHTTSKPWLYEVLGGVQRFREISQRIEAAAG